MNVPIADVTMPSHARQVIRSIIPSLRVSALRILIADDDLFLAEALIRLLTSAGHVTEHAANGLDAWRRLSEPTADFDLVITDHQMPGLTGLELAEMLNRSEFHGRVVVYSSALSEAQHAGYRECGVAEIVLKTSNPDALMGAIEAVASSGVL